MERNRPFVNMEKVLDLWVQLMKIVLRLNNFVQYIFNFLVFCLNWSWNVIWSKVTKINKHNISKLMSKSLSKYLYALSVLRRFTYLTARFSAVSKRNVHWVVLKHRHVFYCVDIGTYCCVFITLLQIRIAAVHNSNIWGLCLKVNALSCWKYALQQTQP